MNRDEALRSLRDNPYGWDLIVVGGGATGVGTALDAASRGYDVALLEQSDFGKGTSTRSTKLIHGGVRYLQQGNIPLVVEALKERGVLRANAPHLVHDLPFVVPNYKWWEAPFYGIGMRVYDVLAGKYGFGQSRNLSREETLERIPNLEDEGLRGGVVYHDGQFDDARLLIALARTAVGQGATLTSYAQVTGLIKDAGGFVVGVTWRDEETGETLELRGRVVVNARPRGSTSCWTGRSWRETRPSWCLTPTTGGSSSPSLGWIASWSAPRTHPWKRPPWSRSLRKRRSASCWSTPIGTWRGILAAGTS
jgi:glycerol-3-phosphate dehydrogenase